MSLCLVGKAQIRVSNLLCRLGTHDGNRRSQMVHSMLLLCKIAFRNLLIFESRPSIRTKIILNLKLGDNTTLFGILWHLPIQVIFRDLDRLHVLLSQS